MKVYILLKENLKKSQRSARSQLYPESWTSRTKALMVGPAVILSIALLPFYIFNILISDLTRYLIKEKKNKILSLSRGAFFYYFFDWNHLTYDGMVTFTRAGFALQVPHVRASLVHRETFHHFKVMSSWCLLRCLDNKHKKWAEKGYHLLHLSLVILLEFYKWCKTRSNPDQYVSETLQHGLCRLNTG